MGGSSGMDFFGHQEQARSASKRLVFLFVLALAGIVTCVYVAAQLLLVATDNGRGGFFDPAVFAVVAIGTLAVVGIAMLFKTAQLKSGGGKVAELLGGRAIEPGTHDPKERMLRNLVEEMAIASGVPVPDIYVLDDETGLNAFAAGWSSADAAVAVTRGCLESLDRDELQGVIAHEFSHVFHGDMRLNIRLMGVLFGIVCLATIGRILVRTLGRGGGNKKGGAAAIAMFGLCLMLIGWIGVLFARLIQAAVSRQREFLADASAVQYTRNPRGIGMALAKIGGLSAQLQSPHTEEASHMLFADGVRRFIGGALATHPPLEQRIERVLPGFRRHLGKGQSLAAAAAATPLPPGVAGLAGGEAPRANARRIVAPALVAAIGDPQAGHVEAARSLLASLPLELATATREPTGARALVAAVLLDRDPARRQAQLERLPADPVLQHEVRAAFQAIARLERTVRLPLVELAVPALRQLSSVERAALGPLLRNLALADGELSAFEFALLKTVERHVRGEGALPPRPGRPTALVNHAGATAVVLSVLARAGAHGDEARAERAFAAGAGAIASPPDLRLFPRERGTVAALEAAVDELASVSPLGKRNLVAACGLAAADDGVLDAEEGDLLRALACLWDCPVPLPADAE